MSQRTTTIGSAQGLHARPGQRRVMITTQERQLVSGIGVGRGFAVAPLAMLRPAPVIPEAARTHDGDAEKATADAVAALAAVADELQTRSARASGAVSDVLGATAGLARDSALKAAVKRYANAGDSAAQAVTSAVGQFEEMFLAAAGPMAERVTDLRSVRDHAVARLLGEPSPGVNLVQRSVVAALDLSPADTAALDLDMVAAIVTEQGGPTGHTAIIAAQLGIPCIVRAVGLTSLATDGDMVAVDTTAGTLTVHPSRDYIARLEALAETERALGADDSLGATADGHRIGLLVNIGTEDDARQLRGAAVEGVGLFRTEVMFLGHTTAPRRSDQEPTYRDVVSALAPRKVVVRTLDAGADKPLAFANLPETENPALGVRGYRLIRTVPQLITEQLAALGSVVTALPETDRDHVWVMAPMISTPAEAREFACTAREYGVTKVGVMIEVPAAALRADAILAEVDFVSLGTNDLAQYTMASDRLRGELADLLDPWQPGVLDLVAATAQAGSRAGKPVGVCGESAADPLMALVLTGLGVSSLSMSPAAVPAVRYAIKRHTLSQCEAVSRAALKADSAQDARQAALCAADHDVMSRLGLIQQI
jgi:phosphoenolpyruvate-protein phosphotransferase (PTS system enzyme I)